MISNSLYNSTNKEYLEHLKSYTTEGHDHNSLISSALPIEASTLESKKSLTLILPIYSKDSLSKLDVALAWTTSTNAIDLKVTIICPSQYKQQIDERLVNTSHFKVKVIDRSTLSTTSISSSTYSPGTAGAAIWLKVLRPQDIETDYLYVMDEQLAPSPYALKELEYLFKVNQLDDYKNALIGTKALVFSPIEGQENFCLPIDSRLPVDKAQPVDMLLGAWLLHKSWLTYIMMDRSVESLNLPLGYYLSLNLHQQLNMPTILLPVALEDQMTNVNRQYCEQVQQEWTVNTPWRQMIAKNRFPTALQYRELKEHGALVVAQGAEQIVSLHPLLCRFKNYPVHLAVLGNNVNKEVVQSALKQTNCDGNVMLHDFSNMKERQEDLSLGRLVEVIKPRILIQIKPAEPKLSPMYYAIQSVANTHQITQIALPEKDIVHALWIPDLSLDALQRK